MDWVQKYIHIFVVMAFVLSSISPACAFISGKSWGEICGADGIVKKVQVPEELLAYLPQDEEEGPSHIAQQMDCSFCFSNANLPAFIPHIEPAPLPSVSAQYIKLSSGVWTPQGLALKPYCAQGPPKTFV